MNSLNQPVAVIGAGPAGLYAARELANHGASVALLNRDIKLGGLAEYGIFHSKNKMKNGLRKQFRQLMMNENIHYYGNLSVGEGGDITLNDLRRLGFRAIIVAVGAQDTKWLGLPGEDLHGVYHAKDLVYHYNQLPPFSERPYPIGKNVVLIGAGNVMLDIARYCVRDLKVESVTAVVRRGPADVKFNKKEMGPVFQNMDLAEFNQEIERTRPILEAVGQETDAARDFILSSEKKSDPSISDTRFKFAFLASPAQIVGEDGKATTLEVNETTLKLRDDGSTGAANTGSTREIPADTVVFCIGDRVDADFGLPLNEWGEFARHPQPRFPVRDISFEAYNLETQQPLDDIFLVGWARQASDGLVGAARKDGERGARATAEYLAGLPPTDASTVFAKFKDCLETLNKSIISKVEWQKLDEIEQDIAEERDLKHFKFGTNGEMLNALGK